MGKGAQKYRNLTLPRQQGERARLRVLGGPDNGNVYVLSSPRVTIGRGEENDVVLSDLKTSRKHAELTLAAGGSAAGNVLRDLGSSHGILVNGAPQKQAFLRSGDKIGLGETVIEFVSAEVGATRMFVAPPGRVAANVGTGTSGLTQFIPRPGMYASAAKGGGLGANVVKASFLEKNKKVLFALAGLMFLTALLPQVEQKQRAKKNAYVEPVELTAERALGGLTPLQMDPAIIRRAEGYFKEGFREFRARNFIRARTQFETSLQIYPDHALSRIYLSSTNKAMEDEAKAHFNDAKRDEEANRVKMAFLHYDAVRRMFSRDQSNPLFKEADTRALELEKRVKDSEFFINRGQ